MQKPKEKTRPRRLKMKRERKNKNRNKTFYVQKNASKTPMYTLCRETAISIASKKAPPEEII